jgi:hypothetical protein
LTQLNNKVKALPQPLHFSPVARELDGFLHYSAAVAVLGEFQDVQPYDSEQSFPVFQFASFKYLLEDIVSELVLS